MTSKANPKFDHLTPGQMRYMKLAYDKGRTVGKLAKQYGVTKFTVVRVLARQGVTVQSDEVKA